MRATLHSADFSRKTARSLQNDAPIFIPPLRGFTAVSAGSGAAFGDEKKQLFHRLPPEFVRRILSEFNAGILDPASAAAQLGIAKTRLYELRSAWLGGRDAFRSKASGGVHRGIWPANVLAFLTPFVPLASPPNFRRR